MVGRKKVGGRTHTSGRSVGGSADAPARTASPRFLPRVHPTTSQTSTGLVAVEAREGGGREASRVPAIGTPEHSCASTDGGGGGGVHAAPPNYTSRAPVALLLRDERPHDAPGEDRPEHDTPGHDLGAGEAARAGVSASGERPAVSRRAAPTPSACSPLKPSPSIQPPRPRP